jgi:two-component system, OmpR family, sensor histidine kinase SenX3
MSASHAQLAGTAPEHRPAPAFELDEAACIRDEFLTLASHELMTPLTSLTLQVQRMKRMSERRAGEAPTWVASLDVVGRQISRLTRLCDDMLQAIKLRSGQLSPERRTVDLGALVRDVVAGVGVEIPAASCAISVDAAEGVVGRWDRAQLERLVFHLLKNAVIFGEGRPVALEVHAGPAGAELLVRDQGMGIAKKDQERIFACFERLVDADHFGGLGLGLYFAREIVRAHDGSIHVESAPGRGSTFIVNLPFDPSAAGWSLSR